MRRRRLLVGLFFLPVVLWGWCIKPGFTPTEQLLVLLASATPFTSEAWRTADPRARGKMLRDLLRRHHFIGKKNTDVEQLLGESDCYLDYDDEPCYRVNLLGLDQSLGFGVNHSTHPGFVLGFSLRSF